MAIPWLAVLQVVPWTEVIKNAPKVAEGAKKLWNTVSNNDPAVDAPMKTTASAPVPETISPAMLQSRITAMERATADLHAQMLASSELIKSLADQNAQLIQGIDRNRVRLVWLTRATVLLGIVAALCLLLLLLG